MTPTSTDDRKAGRGRRIRRVIGLGLLALGLSLSAAGRPAQDIAAPAAAPATGRSCGSWASTPRPSPSTTSSTRPQFQLHTLLTEQRHPKTWTLSERIRTDTEAGLRMLLAVDADVTARLEALAGQAAGPGPDGRRDRQGPGRAAQDLRLRLRGHRPAGQADGEHLLAAVLAPAEGRRRGLGQSPRTPRPGRRGRADRRDDRRRPGPDQLARRVRGSPAHRPAPA